MFGWMNKRRSTTPAGKIAEDATTATKRHGREMSGTYRLLYEHLERRYADTVVLTFAQVEDVLGFALPDRARSDREWWTAADTNAAESCYSNAWTLTRRTAKPNLLARNVVFERAFG